MGDIAEIGFKAQTDDLEKAATKLNAIRPAAAGAVKASEQMAQAIGAAGRSVSNTAVLVAKAEKSAADASLARVRANQQATAAELQTAVATQKAANARLLDAKAMRDQATAINALKKEVQSAQSLSTSMASKGGLTQRAVFGGGGLSGAFGGAAGRGGRGGAGGGGAANGNNRFVTGNILAQFQDIGVTAAMGMNPLTIAIQQGSQLADVLRTMESPLKGIAQGFKALFGGVQIVTIGIIALVAAFIEMVNWTDVAKAILNSLANAIQKFGPYMIAAAAAVTTIFIPSLIRMTYQMTIAATTALWAGAQIAAAWLLANPVILIAAIAAVLAAITVWAVQAIKPVKDFINNFIGLFVGAFNGVKKQWENLPAVMGGAAIEGVNKVIDNFENMINTLIPAINKLLEKLPEWMGGKMVIQPISLSRVANPYKGALEDFNKSISESIAKAQNVDYVGKLINGAKNASMKAAQSIRNYAKGLGEDDKHHKKTDAEKFADVLNKGGRDMATMKAEADAYGLSENAAAKLKYETELLNDAKEKNLNLTDAQRGQLSDLAQKMADVAVATRLQKEAVDFAKDTTKSFISDLRAGLQQGKTAWESFGNAVSNVLNKILDKMVDLSIDSLFGGSKGGGAGSGIGDFITKGAKSLFSLFSAKGNVFSGGGVTPFAKGGMFTNNIVSKPTMFAYGNGGTFGVMGEKGAEAIMPLARGPDGSLGVKSGGGGGDMVVNIYEAPGTKSTTSQRKTSRGMELDVMLDTTNASNIADQGSMTARALDARASRQLIKR
jgi:lambda family phage tail tape measure protein